MNTQAIRQVFDRSAHTYSAAAALDHSVADELLARLDLLNTDLQRILDAGCGDGYCADALRNRYPDSDLIGIDLSQAMLCAASSRGVMPAEFSLAHAERLPFADGAFDLIFSNLLLPWCDIGAALVELRRVMRPGAGLMFTTFGPDTLIELRQAWAKVDELPHVHDFYDMHDIGDALLHAGFAEPIVDVDRVTVTYASAESMIAELKASGATNIHPRRRTTLTGKRRFHRFLSELDTLRDTDGRIPLTYEVIYGHAWAPGQPDSAAVTIPLDAVQPR